MLSTVKNISVTYDAINESNTFSSGDYISGRIILELAKDCKIEYLLIKAKGKAEVRWTEKHGQTTVTYHAKDKYFSMKQYIIQEQKGQGGDYQTLISGQGGIAYSNVVAPGSHVYPFTFQIPQQEMPPSFKGCVGKIIYILEARLGRSMRIDSKATTEFTFVSKTNINNIPGLMAPQYGTKDKKLKFFTSGTVAMDVSIEKMGYYQGEGLKVVAAIHNNSSREIKPKYLLYRKHSFFARGKRRVHTKDILKEEGEPIPPSANQTVTKIVNVPRDIGMSILNCNIIMAEYRLRVYLDVKYASDPEIKFPVVILSACQAPGQVEEPPPYAGFGFGAFGNSNQPAWNGSPAAPQFPAASQNPAAPQYPASLQYPTAPQFQAAPPFPTAPQFPTASASETFGPPPSYGSVYPEFGQKS